MSAKLRIEKFYAQYVESRPTGERDRSWSGSRQKRAFDFAVATIGLALVSPIMLLAAVMVNLSSSGPILFRQRRMGKGGREFIIYKFRTMKVQASQCGPCVTTVGDPRLTPIGAMMRRFKIDEIPQLLNVLKGEMSLVGTRPKVPQHQTYELKYHPGITGAATLAFRDEERILTRVEQEALDRYQVHVLMPLKSYLDRNYMEKATFRSDLRILAATIFGSGERMGQEDLTRFQDSLISLDTALRIELGSGIVHVEDSVDAGLAHASVSR